jgi:chorismate synthase
MDARSPAPLSSRPGPSTPESAHATITTRPIESLAELQACVVLQEHVWGAGFSEAVPVSLLKAATYVGGLAIGAYDRDDTLVGFVFGLTGVHEGRTLHWSHLLGVADAARNLGVGRMLKEHQRHELARRGIDEMRWTFDPLIAKNAHLNLNLLGARFVRFTPNMYGTTSTPLHHGLPTDRFVVSCSTSDGVGIRRRVELAANGTPILSLEPQLEDDLVDTRRLPARIRLEVPTDFQTLMTQSPARAAEWHAAFRTQLMWALENGYAVAGLQRDAVSSRSFYVLTLESAA